LVACQGTAVPLSTLLASVFAVAVVIGWARHVATAAAEFSGTNA
jgi:hypothetical protein